MSTISELEKEIRRYINAPRKHSELFKDRLEFYKLCSCLDVIGDTEQAFEAYDSMLDSDQPGSAYIIAYGFFKRSSSSRMRSDTSTRLFTFLMHDVGHRPESLRR